MCKLFALKLVECFILASILHISIYLVCIEYRTEQGTYYLSQSSSSMNCRSYLQDLVLMALWLEIRIHAWMIVMAHIVMMTRDLIDLKTYTQPEDLGEDSDTLPTPTRNATLDNSSSISSRASKKRTRDSNSPTKKQSKNKSRFAESTDEISATMKSLRDAFQSTTPPMP